MSEAMLYKKFRVAGAFRRVAQLSDTSNNLPTVSQADLQRVNMPAMANSEHVKGPTGRWRDRERHKYRPSHASTLVEMDTLHLGLLNSEGWDWRRLSGRDKTAELIRHARQSGIQIWSLTELHNREACDQDAVDCVTVFIEEYVFILGRTSGFMLFWAAFKAWESEGRRVWRTGDHWLAIAIKWGSLSFSCISGYVPVSGGVGPKKAAYGHATFLYEKIKVDYDTQSWCADWNGHASRLACGPGTRRQPDFEHTHHGGGQAAQDVAISTKRPDSARQLLPHQVQGDVEA